MTLINTYGLPFDKRIELVKASNGIKKEVIGENITRYKSYLQFRNTQVQVWLKNNWENSNNNWQDATVDEIKNQCWNDLDNNITVVFSCWNSSQNRYNPCIILLKNKYTQNNQEYYQVEFRLGNFSIYDSVSYNITKAKVIKNNQLGLLGFELLNNSNNKVVKFNIYETNLCYGVNTSQVKFTPAGLNQSYYINLSNGNDVVSTHSMAFIAIIGDGYDSIQNSEDNNRKVEIEYFSNLYHNSILFLGSNEEISINLVRFECFQSTHGENKFILNVVPRRGGQKK